MKTLLKQFFLAAFLLVLAVSCTKHTSTSSQFAANDFLRVQGGEVLDCNNDTFYIQGVNLGNWLNPEGYMFRLAGKCNAPRLINDLFSELAGPAETELFWQEWRMRYITHDDIRFIASTGANTIRLPFHYQLFTTDLYLGSRNPEEGFAMLDSCIKWCEEEGIRVVLDMHDCPGGQTGDNIDDSYGYPFLFISERSQELFCDIWKQLAARYKNEPTVLGYELMNEPIAHYFAADTSWMNHRLLPLYERCIAAIRQVDNNHIILLGAPQWNGNFNVPLVPAEPLNKNILYACHRYGHPASDEGIRDFIAFKDSLGVAMCMTETGHRNPEWYQEQAETLRRNRIGFLFWPYKKMGESSWVGFAAPQNWETIQAFSQADRSSFEAIRNARPDIELARNTLQSLLDSVLFEHCRIDSAYINALQLK